MTALIVVVPGCTLTSYVCTALLILIVPFTAVDDDVCHSVPKYNNSLYRILMCKMYLYSGTEWHLVPGIKLPDISTCLVGCTSLGYVTFV